MEIEFYINEIKMALGALDGETELEADDKTLAQIINSSLATVQSFVYQKTKETIEYSPCIKLDEVLHCKVDKVFSVRRGISGKSVKCENVNGNVPNPLGLGLPLAVGGGAIVNRMNIATQNYAGWLIMQQTLNTMRTDARACFMKQRQELYVEFNMPVSQITIEYVPIFESIEEITEDFWVQKVRPLAIARTKRYIGLKLGHYTLNNAPWQDYAQLLQTEGKQEEDKIMDDLTRSRGSVIGKIRN